MVTTRTRKHGLLCAAVAGSLTLLAAGCSDDTSAKAADIVTADKLCGGAAVTKDGAKALEVITGETRFEASGEQSNVAVAAEELTREAVPASSGNGDICRLYPEAPVNELRVTWELSNMAPRGPAAASEFTILPMGEEAGAAHDTAFVTFACSHKEHPLARPDHISVWVSATGMPTEPEGDERPQKNAYATLAHSFALAMAKALGCEDNAGLKPKPSLIPAS